MLKLMMVSLLLQCSFLGFTQVKDSIIAQRKYTAQRVQNESIEIDGDINDLAWQSIPFAGDFLQREPNEGRVPTETTRFKIAYDDKYFYAAIYCYDSQPDSIVKRMGRRDDFPGDMVEINIDSYHDQRTAFSFSVSASGVRGDEFVSNNGQNWDDNWNPIWFAKTKIVRDGWMAEVKIPFSQLRYGNESEKEWGFQVSRLLFRKKERSIFQFIPQRAGVWVSSFAMLDGINNIPSHKQLEIAPYITAQADKYKKEPGNPFAEGLDKKFTAGVDGKLAITNDLILDFTINPDFGQVEADPSKVRIDGFQNFFEERRPFFIESRNIFEYQLTGSEADGDFNADLLFYSRRIGGAPHGDVLLNAGEYAKLAQNTAILGAAKFSGKTRRGLSIGVLESVTQREFAQVDHYGQRSRRMIEPLSSYFVGRLQQDFQKGNTVIGGIFTAVNRENGLEDLLHRSAYSAGFDFMHYWDNRTWFLRGNMVFSQVNGSNKAIYLTQTSFEHLFQRPGNTGLVLDSNRNALTGTGGTLRFGKSAGRAGKLGQVFKFETGITMRSPQLELNDIGFMLSANEINHFTWLGLQYPMPFSVFRNARVNFNQVSRWDYSGKFLFQFFNTNAHATFRDNWETGVGFDWNPYDVSNNALRGAQAIRRPGGGGFWSYLNSDSRKKFQANIQVNGFWGESHAMHSKDVSLEFRYQPINALTLSLGSSYGNYFRRQDQFVENVKYQDKPRSIVASVKQQTLRFVLEANYNITPDLTVQYYGQPYITRPLYSNYSWVINAMAKNYDDRFQSFSAAQLSSNDHQYFIDENNDGTADYSFNKPDFNFVQFRSNLVARWEYKPGSELYLVWSQANTPDVGNELVTPFTGSLFNNVLTGQPRNIFLVKWTYRFLK